MKLLLAMLFSTFVLAPSAFATGYIDDSVNLHIQEPAVAEVDEEAVDPTEEVDEIIIPGSEEEYSAWIDLLEEENAETVYVDEDGNEYYFDSSDVAENSKKTAKLKKKKSKKNKKGGGRNCVAVSGGASWYGPGFHGRKTANGERFNQNALTAAHKTLKFGSKVRVTYKGRSVIVRINDAGPYAGGRVIDLSKAAAASIGLIGAGHGRVTLEVVSCG